MPSLRCRSGQASLEYVGVLALLVLVLGGAGTAVLAPDLPGTVVRHVRVALCVVGGDVCRTADARAQGLEPCVVVDGEDRERRGVSLAFVRLGRDSAWSAQRRSDGTIALTYEDGAEGGATAGVGVELGPALDLAASGQAGLAFRSGSTWELADEAALARALAAGHDRVRDHLPAPTYRFVAGGAAAAGDAGLELGSGRAATSEGLAEAAARRALGRRTGRGRTTFYFDGGDDVSTVVPGLAASGRAVVELTTGSPPTLTVRATTTAGGRAVEHVGRMPLTDGVVRDALVRVLGTSGTPIRAAARVPAVARALGERMAWQRFTYAVERTSEDSSFSISLGGRLGHEHERTETRRRLVDAQVLGPLPARRRDCLGV
ncbi:MAG TPA: hypothetical protein VM266_05180 [Solirubrobacteraceae bacterium]|nr:hypothetical protein [Solirubrobacteraceae bacterium]